MEQSEFSAVSTKLKAWRGGDLQARDWLISTLSTELQQISAALLRAERATSLSTGDLVNEAVLRIIRLNRMEIVDKVHLLALSAQAMRRVLIDAARKRQSSKHAHGKVTLVTGISDAPQEQLDLDMLNKALIRLSVMDPLKGEIVEMRYFGGLSVEQIAEVLGVSTATVKRHWRSARAWLLDAMSEDRG